MLDFKRIGGEIVSAPLNENFRRLRNDISIANTNLIFSRENGTVNNLEEMHAIDNPEEGQACYVISSGELYRFSKYDNEWHKIADFGNTFRQGFLNSGVVVLEDYVRLVEGSTTSIKIPQMLIYFKNKNGDDKYLKGMYLIQEHIIDLTTIPIAKGIYYIYIDGTKLGTDNEISIVNKKKTDNSPNLIYLGAFLVDKTNNVIPQFVYTIPNMAFTADRGAFLLHNGEASGLNLGGISNSNKVSREPGHYYAEGINFVTGNTDDYPVDTDNGSNYNIKYFAPVDEVQKIYYAIPAKKPNSPLDYDVTETNGLIINKYWDKEVEELKDVAEGQFTVQQHIVTPNGQNVIFYGQDVYNSLEDAKSNINAVYGIDNNFPHVETTRIVVGNKGEQFDSNDNTMCVFYTLGHLSQVGTMVPHFADNDFMLYSGQINDDIPAQLQISLDDLQNDNFDELFTLSSAAHNTIRHKFALDKKYINDIQDPEIVTKDVEDVRAYNGSAGYLIADNEDLNDLIRRINDIETEIWDVKQEDAERYRQSIRYRLNTNENHLDSVDNTLTAHSNKITWLENNKVNKQTKINGYTLGDTEEKDELKDIILKTGDISEGAGLGTITNLWYTDERVNNNSNVAASTDHRNKISLDDDATNHTVVNPHNLSTDDIKLLTNTQKIFVTPDEERRIRSDKLPDNTIQELADLDAKTMDNIRIDKLDGNPTTTTGTLTNIGNVRNIRFYEDGVDLSLNDSADTLIIDCMGHIDTEPMMFKNDYAAQSIVYPETLKGYVDKAIIADSVENVSGIEVAGINKYYGTNDTGEAGFHDLVKYVSTADTGSFTDIDQVIFVPVDGSIQERHLSEDLKNKINNNYHIVYNNGTISSNEVNEFNFGNNLIVSIEGHKATINASGTGGEAGISNFVNLNDVDVTYTGNAGKLLTVNEAENGITLSSIPSLSAFMLKAAYVDDNDISKVKKAVNADLAIKSTTSDNALKLNNKIVDDTQNDNNVLWTASKIIETIGNKITNEGVNTYSGVDIPEDSLGKNGDLYILIEEI